MFCLRSWIPLLFIPTNASPIYVALFFICTYFLNRPCIYCAFLLLFLFASSCNWSEHCFLDYNSNWFEPTSTSPTAMADDISNTLVNGTIPQGALEQLVDIVRSANETGKVLGAVALQEMREVLGGRPEWTGIGLGWLRSLLGRREWTIDCMNVKIRL